MREAHDKSVERVLQVAGRIGGVAFVACFLGDVLILPGEPSPDGSAGALASYFGAHAGAVETVSLLHVLGGAMFLLFLAALLETAPWQRSPGLRRLALSAGLAAGGLGLASYMAGGAAAFLASRPADHSLVGIAAELEYVASSYADVPLALFLVACAVAWRGWRRVLAALAAMLLLLGVTATYDPSNVLGLAGFAGSLLFAVCVFAVSVAPATRHQVGESSRFGSSSPALG